MEMVYVLESDRNALKCDGVAFKGEEKEVGRHLRVTRRH